VLLNYKAAAVAAVILMTAGTALGSPEVRAWSLLVGIFAAALGIAAVVRRGTEAMKAYVHRWTLQTYEHGMKQGIEMGREIEAAEKFIASTRDG
jgi:hypothetical protein